MELPYFLETVISGCLGWHSMVSRVNLSFVCLAGSVAVLQHPCGTGSKPQRAVVPHRALISESWAQSGALGVKAALSTRRLLLDWGVFAACFKCSLVRCSGTENGWVVETIVQ